MQSLLDSLATSDKGDMGKEAGKCLHIRQVAV